jgi:hypothetical protein
MTENDLMDALTISGSPSTDLSNLYYSQNPTTSRA